VSTVSAPADQLRLAGVQAREVLVDALARRSFQRQSHLKDTWRGPVPHRDGTVTVLDIAVPADFPYAAPVVKPLTVAAASEWTGQTIEGYREASWSWHRERNGQMCLFERDDPTRLPWADPTALFEQIEAWLDQDIDGWPHDEPALDLDRYFRGSGMTVLYDDLAPVAGRVVHLRTARNGCRVVGLPVRPRLGKRGRPLPWPRSSALVLDLGELRSPIRDWPSLVASAGTESDKLITLVQGGIRELVVRYRRGENLGALALEVHAQGDSFGLRAHVTAPLDPATLMRRSHPRHAELASCSVAVVGVGAVGSTVADLLHRSGVGRLELLDRDRLLPGNAVRHLAGADHVGQSKVDAVKQVLTRTRPGTGCRVNARFEAVSTLAEAGALLQSADLVIDATADATASTLLAAAATAGAGRVVSVAVLADGYAVRVDHWPAPAPGALPAPDLPPAAPGVYEAGCSSPVSTTPPAAVWEAAAVAARHAIDELLTVPHAAGEERRLHPGPAA
jgi:molybdopterin/thiamine biosynthesis adenylyltransferase